MRFHDWVSVRETLSDPNSATKTWQAGAGEPPVATTRYQPPAMTGPLMDRIRQWYDYHYQNFGGWKAVEQGARNDPDTAAMLSQLQHQASHFRPEVDTEGGADDAEWATERWVDQVTQKVAEHMRHKGHSVWGRGSPQDTPRDLGSRDTAVSATQGDATQYLRDRLNDLEERVNQMSQFLKRLHPDQFGA
jgi:hypothetical protein